MAPAAASGRSLGEDLPTSSGPRKTRRSGNAKGKRSPPQPLDLDPGAASCRFAVWMVWAWSSCNCQPRLHVHPDQLFWLAALAGPVRRDAAHLLFVHGADLRRPALDGDLDRVAAHPRRRHRHRVQNPTTPYTAAGPRAAVRLRRRQLRLEHGEHQLLLPEGRKGTALG